MIYVVFYLATLCVCLIPMYIITYYIPLKKNKLEAQGSFKLIVQKYDLNMDKARVRLLSKIVCVVNAFIMSIPIYMVLFANINRIVMFAIAFVIFVVGIAGSYNLIGYILKKKGW